MLCYVVNLDRDAERMADMRAALARYEFLNVIRISAFRGADLPDTACEVLTRSPGMKNHKGALGCSLSHVFAWESFIASGETWAVVLEDDSRPHHLELLKGWHPPVELDLIFCNSRMVYRDTGEMSLLPFFPAFDFTIKNQTAIGADGYIISAKGARKLLDYIKTDGFYSHIDLRLAAYGLTPIEMQELPQRQYVIKDICTLRKLYLPDHHLDVRVLGTSFTVHVKGAPSSRESEDRRARSSD
jgi:GR25 family glycosyltransferase involved in LPS biosynthesis